ncbi:hypothetical protein COU80_05040 [Candidatus Peregrinibacteria bacterium CG10_big_fil_rev_8_21_14_0_10_55_24]|nr:MAG: hypothetical protein COU80_05040 [Candidatus Peregrinibacteria bacterium CG10_big_fil_rev_8_21_14_0_10_55_24]
MTEHLDQPQSDEAIVQLHADPHESHMDVANRAMAQLELWGKYFIGHPDDEGRFFVTIPHVSAQVREQIQALALTVVDKHDDRYTKHRPLPTSALPAFNRGFVPASAEV